MARPLARPLVLLQWLAALVLVMALLLPTPATARKRRKKDPAPGSKYTPPIPDPCPKWVGSTSGYAHDMGLLAELVSRWMDTDVPKCLAGLLGPTPPDPTDPQSRRPTTTRLTGGCLQASDDARDAEGVCADWKLLKVSQCFVHTTGHRPSACSLSLIHTPQNSVDRGTDVRGAV